MVINVSSVVMITVVPTLVLVMVLINSPSSSLFAIKFVDVSGGSEFEEVCCCWW